MVKRQYNHSKDHAQGEHVTSNVAVQLSVVGGVRLKLLVMLATSIAVSGGQGIIGLTVKHLNATLPSAQPLWLAVLFEVVVSHHTSAGECSSCQG